MTLNQNTALGITVAVCISVVALVLLTLVDRDHQAAETARDQIEASLKQKVADKTTALKAAKYLILHADVVQDYASRSEPEIRLCVPSFGDSKVLRVEHCMPGEHEVVFPISYLGSDHHPEFGEPTVDYRSLNSP